MRKQTLLLVSLLMSSSALFAEPNPLAGAATEVAKDSATGAAQESITGTATNAVKDSVKSTVKETVTETTKGATNTAKEMVRDAIVPKEPAQATEAMDKAQMTDKPSETAPAATTTEPEKKVKNKAHKKSKKQH
jgi:hypothetical protein